MWGSWILSGGRMHPTPLIHPVGLLIECAKLPRAADLSHYSLQLQEDLQVLGDTW